MWMWMQQMWMGNGDQGVRTQLLPSIYLPTGLNQQKLLILAVKNCKCIPFHRTFLGYHLLMGLFWGFARPENSPRKVLVSPRYQ
jgi:hypothetical protein